MGTNVLVYASRSTARAHRQANGALTRAEDEGDELCVGRRVPREYLATVTRPQADATPLPPEAAVADLQRFAEIFTVLKDGPAVTEELLRPVVRLPHGRRAGARRQPGRKRLSPLVATMLAHGVTRLLTFNEADFRRFGAMVTPETIEPT